MDIQVKQNIDYLRDFLPLFLLFCDVKCFLVKLFNHFDKLSKSIDAPLYFSNLSIFPSLPNNATKSGYFFTENCFPSCKFLPRLSPNEAKPSARCRYARDAYIGEVSYFSLKSMIATDGWPGVGENASNRDWMCCAKFTLTIKPMLRRALCT